MMAVVMAAARAAVTVAVTAAMEAGEAVAPVVTAAAMAERQRRSAIVRHGNGGGDGSGNGGGSGSGGDGGGDGSGGDGSSNGGVGGGDGGGAGHLPASLRLEPACGQHVQGGPCEFEALIAPFVVEDVVVARKERCRLGCRGTEAQPAASQLSTPAAISCASGILIGLARCTSGARLLHDSMDGALPPSTPASTMLTCWPRSVSDGGTMAGSPPATAATLIESDTRADMPVRRDQLRIKMWKAGLAFV